MRFLKAFFAALTFFVVAYQAFADSDNGISKVENDFCQRKACFSQTVVTKVKIAQVGKESVVVDQTSGDVYLNFDVTGKREYEPGKFVDTEYTISQWIGNGADRLADLKANVRAFADALRKMSTTKAEINLVVRGSASGMVGEFPLLGFFTAAGQFFFLERTATPTGTTEG